MTYFVDRENPTAGDPDFDIQRACPTCSRVFPTDAGYDGHLPMCNDNEADNLNAIDMASPDL